MLLQNKIHEDMRTAMKARETIRLLTLRGLLADFTNELVALNRTPRGELTDPEAIAVLNRAAKRRRDSIEQFSAGKREDLADKERAELSLIKGYLPAEMNREEMEKIILAKKAELGLSGQKDLPQLMSAVMKELKGKASGDTVREIAEKTLTEIT